MINWIFGTFGMFIMLYFIYLTIDTVKGEKSACELCGEHCGICDNSSS